MLFERLEKVREQPKEIRRRFALVWSTIITVVVVLIWISILIGRSYALSGPEPEIQADQPVTEVLPENLRNIFDQSNSFLADDVFTSEPEEVFDVEQQETSSSSSTELESSATSTGTSTEYTDGEME